MKKIFYIFIIFIMLQLPVFSLTLSGNAEFDWINLKQEDRDSEIQKIKTEIFTDDLVKKFDKNIFKTQYLNNYKDTNYLENRYFLENKTTELDDKYLVGFFVKSILYAYGIINKSDLYRAYYYNAIGSLFIVEIFDKPYNDYPVISKQYSKNGKLLGVIYNKGESDNFVYDPNGNFLGRWYNDKYYNRNGKIIMRRSFNF